MVGLIAQIKPCIIQVLRVHLVIISAATMIDQFIARGFRDAHLTHEH